MSDIDVAVVIVSYQSAKLTVDCLKSIEAERATADMRIRVIVVDNASGDASVITKEVEANQWSTWVTSVQAPRNGGFAYANNLGLRRACDYGIPDYFHMLNPDTLVRKGAIGALARFLETNPAVGIAGSGFENLDGSKWPIAFRFPSIMSEVESGLQFGIMSRILQPWVVAMQMSSVAQPVDWVSGASMMVRRTVLDAIGGFDENYFLYFEETDFCWRARKAGFSTWYVPESLVMHIAGQSTSVTVRNAHPKRLPAYWFESRRRFFSVAYGTPYAMAADLAALVGHGLGSLKRFVLGRRDRAIPGFLADLMQHSLLWPRNRRLPQIRTIKWEQRLRHGQ
jgi:N-acetylglucosaminyl-diphospho-decaprenol L-rhamnosyltransferase